ncbi:MAG: DNA polymerase III subunit gamma/tau, partial [Clostridia bacterium]|nr:DNA polymerase III subunit gamma/tau [Clostridia bacterium]
YRKWRPMRFEDVVGQEHVTRTLRAQSMASRLSHAYLFCGPRGTGKTTCARILAKAANCTSPVNGDPCNSCAACRAINDGSATDVFEMDAATYTGVDDIRALRAEAVYAPSALRKKVYIIDEVHMLSVSAFNAFLKILEEPPEHVMFVLASTELHKIPATVLSRCQRFEFSRIQRTDITDRLLHIAEKENIMLERGGAALISAMADGAMRNALSLLEQASSQGGDRLDSRTVASALGIVSADSLLEIFGHILAGDSAEALRLFGEQYSAGAEPEAFCDQLLSLARDVLMVYSGVDCDVIGAGYSAGELGEFTANATGEQLLSIVKTVGECLWSLPKSPNKRIDAELCVYTLCNPAVSGGNAALAARVAAIEKQLSEGVAIAPPAAKAAAPAPAAPKAPKPAPQKSRAESGETEKSGRFALGAELVKSLESRLDPVSASCLGYCQFKRRGNVLCIVTSDSIAYEMLNNRSLLDMAAAEAAKLEEGITLAKAELQKADLGGFSAGDETDNLDALVSFMNENSDISHISK